ncbi:DUF5047 domain-containing protein [Streptomyces sp. SID5770]|uniref:DUF5047 domain-containing protein n=1 Tax=Streptomyces sp. SID5770 TaxID=2690308 RepID=UPI001369ADC9|nr:DUF5047 domain-containing protein [Streptomyces sp. SID5770]MZE56487.1 DUF5047 domain-containing protein [Streptomyces sp. SID5770]
MLTASDTYRQVLPAPHKRAFRIDVTDIDGVVRANGLRPLAGSVTAAATQTVTRQADFTLKDVWYPGTSEDALCPEFAVVHVHAGVEYGNGLTELFPIFTGRVDTVDRRPDGSVAFACFDLGADVVAYDFEQPRTTSAPTALAEIRSLITEALPQAEFGEDTVPDAPTPQLTWDSDRGSALDDLAQSLGGRWYALGDGRFVVRSFAYAPGPVVAEYADRPRGVVTAATASRSRAGGFNGVVVVSERTDGSDPIRVPARVNDPSHPLYFGGRYGKVTQVINTPTPVSLTTAQLLAQTQLSASSALREQWTASIVPDYTLELGDTVRLGWRGRSAIQIIDQIVYPLSPGEPMEIVGRAGVEPQ